MTRTWSARLLALGGLTLALGCRSAPMAPVYTSPVITTPLLPEMVAPPTVALAPPPTTPSLSLAPVPTAPPVTPPVDPPLILPPGAQLPMPVDPPALELPEPRLARTPADLGPAPPGSDLPPILPPRDVVGVLTSNPKPAAPQGPILPPAVKPLLIEAPRPPAGPDGFAPAPKIPAPAPMYEGPPPKIVNGLPPSATPLKPGEKYGHAPDYKWVAGVLDRHAKGGYWTIRYMDYGADDEWGGKVRLMEHPKLHDFRNGDVVYVEGELLAPRAARAEPAVYPPYKVTSVQLVPAK